MRELYRVKINLIALNKGTLPYNTYEASRAFILNIISLSNEKLAKYLHREGVTKPYGINPLRPLNKAKGEKGWYINEGDRLILDLGFIDDKENSILMSLVTAYSKKSEWDFLNIKVKIDSFSVNRIMIQQVANRIGLLFKTPTAFSSKRIDFPILFPIPYILFSNLLNIWNALMDEKIDFDIASWAKTNVYAKAYRLYTREITIKGVKLTGFKGKIEYIFINADEKIKDTISKLFTLGKVINVGIKRTFGMGVFDFKNLE